MKCPECNISFPSPAQKCVCGWAEPRQESLEMPLGLDGGRSKYNLDPIAFEEQFEGLRMAYPSEARNMTSQIKAWWWKHLRAEDTSLFVKAIIAAKIKSPTRIPTLSTIEGCISDALLEKAKSNHEYVKKQVLTDYLPKDLKDSTSKQIAADVFRVLQSGDITPKKWRVLARKYKNVKNKAAPGSMGTFFMEQGLILARFRLNRQRVETRKQESFA